MQWSAQRYYSEIVCKRRVAVIGWPANIKFINPFCITGLNNIGRLHFSWRREEIYFHKLSESEFLEWQSVLEPLAETVRLASLLCRAPRSDIGDTRALRPVETRGRRRRAQGGLKSARFMEELED